MGYSIITNPVDRASFRLQYGTVEEIMTAKAVPREVAQWYADHCNECMAMSYLGGPTQHAYPWRIINELHAKYQGAPPW